MQTAGTKISLELIAEQLLNIIRYDPAETVDSEGKVLPLNEIPRHARAGILSYEPSAAGTKVRGYNKLTAIGLALKLRDNIQLAVNKENKLSKAEQMLLDEAEEGLLGIISFDPAETVDHEGNMLQLNEIPQSTRTAILTYETTTSGTKVHGYNKLTAVALVMKLKGLGPPGKSGEITAEDEIDDEDDYWMSPEEREIFNKRFEEEY